MASGKPRLDLLVLDPDPLDKESVISQLVSYSGPDLQSFVTDSYQVFLTMSMRFRKKNQKIGALKFESDLQKGRGGTLIPSRILRY